MVTHPLLRPWAPSANPQRQAERVCVQANRAWAPSGTSDSVGQRLRRDSAADRQDHSGRGARHLPCRIIRDTGAHRQAGDRRGSVGARSRGRARVPCRGSSPSVSIDLPRRPRRRLASTPHRRRPEYRPARLESWSGRTATSMLFARWLRDHEADRDLDADARKRASAAAGGSSRYNDAKSGVAYDIYERAFLADPLHQHRPQPRPS